MMNKKLVDAGALQMVRNALQRDAEEGKTVRGEMLESLDAATQHFELSMSMQQLCEALASMVNTFGTSHKELTDDPTRFQLSTQLARDALVSVGQEALIEKHLVAAGVQVEQPASAPA